MLSHGACWLGGPTPNSPSVTCKRQLVSAQNCCNFIRPRKVQVTENPQHTEREARTLRTHETFLRPEATSKSCLREEFLEILTYESLQSKVNLDWLSRTHAINQNRKRACFNSANGSQNYTYKKQEPVQRSQRGDWLQAGWPRDRSSAPRKSKNFLFSTSSRTVLRPTPPPIQRIQGGSFPRSKEAEEWRWPLVLKLMLRSWKSGSIHLLPHTTFARFQL
jgi:hypothetical protein